MEDHEQYIDPGYISQFNNGYLLSKHQPELAGKLSEAFGNSALFQGFNQGREQGALEQQRDARLSWLYRERTQDDIAPDKDRDSPDKG